MHKINISPTSMAELIQLARILQAQDDLTETDALERAAAMAGYPSLEEAQVAFEISSGPHATISASFSNDRGRWILRSRTPLRQDLRLFLKPRHLRICERFDQFCLAHDNSIEADLGRVNETFVRERIAQVVHTIQFMDATGLRPTLEEIYGFKTYSKEQRLPGQDHATHWVDPRTGGHIMMDEPYGYVDKLYAQRQAWCERNGLIIHRLKWGGTYRPEHGLVCELVAQRGQGALIEDIAERIRQARPEVGQSKASGMLQRRA